MNLFSMQEHLRDYSQTQLTKEMQQPSGSVPQFMIMTEMQRRKRMQESYQAASGQGGPASTVAEDMVAAAGIPGGQAQDMAQSLAPQTDMGGNGGIAGMMPQQAPPQAPAPVQSYAGGGLAGGASDMTTLRALAAQMGLSVGEVRAALEGGYTPDMDETFGSGVEWDALGDTGGLASLSEADPSIDTRSPSHNDFANFADDFPGLLADPDMPDDSDFAYGGPLQSTGRSDPARVSDPSMMDTLVSEPSPAAAWAGDAFTQGGEFPESEWADTNSEALSGRALQSEINARDSGSLAPSADHEFGRPGGMLGDIGELGSRAVTSAVPWARDMVGQVADSVNRVVNPAVEYATGHTFPENDPMGLWGPGMTRGGDPLTGDLLPPAPGAANTPPQSETTRPKAPDRSGIMAAAPTGGATSGGSSSGGGGGGGGGGLSIAPASSSGGTRDKFYEQDKWLALARFGAALMDPRNSIGSAAGEGLDALGQARKDYLDRKQVAEEMSLKTRIAAANASRRGRGSAPKPAKINDLLKYQETLTDRLSMLGSAENAASEGKAGQWSQLSRESKAIGAKISSRLGSGSLSEYDPTQVDLTQE